MPEHQQHQHQHHHHTEEEKEKKRRKQKKRMEKILGQAWHLDDATKAFQEDRKKRSNEEYVVALDTIGAKIDGDRYRLGRHGWEDFAADLGGVYNRHIRR